MTNEGFFGIRRYTPQRHPRQHRKQPHQRWASQPDLQVDDHRAQAGNRIQQNRLPFEPPIGSFQVFGSEPSQDQKQEERDKDRQPPAPIVLQGDAEVRSRRIPNPVFPGDDRAG